jgi:protein SCO1
MSTIGRMPQRDQRADASIRLTRRACLAALLPGSVCAQGTSPPIAPTIPPPAWPEVALQDQDGHIRRLRGELIDGGPVVLSFMFTSCATTCPPQTATMRELRRRLDADADAALRGVLLLSVTVDPVADGPAQLKAYAQRYDIAAGRERGWVFLTGERAALAKVWRAFGVDVSAREAHSNLLWITHPARGRWTRSSALNAPADLLRAVREVAA